jgi:hypothetical protein
MCSMQWNGIVPCFSYRDNWSCFIKYRTAFKLETFFTISTSYIGATLNGANAPRANPTYDRALQRQRCKIVQDQEENIFNGFIDRSSRYIVNVIPRQTLKIWTDYILKN